MCYLTNINTLKICDSSLGHRKYFVLSILNYSDFSGYINLPNLFIGILKFGIFYPSEIVWGKNSLFFISLVLFFFIKLSDPKVLGITF